MATPLIGRSAPASKTRDRRRIVIMTDLEPDDRVAMHLLASRLRASQIAMIGTTVMHAGRKRLLAERLMGQLGLSGVPVYQGSGGSGDSYPPIASSAATRTYVDEGKDILSERELSDIGRAPVTSSDFSANLSTLLQNSGKGEIDFAVMAAPTDLVAVLRKSPELKEKIGRVYIMGGWVEVAGTSKESISRFTTYNWNMDPTSTQLLLRMEDIPMTIFSSHLIKPSFGGGSININNFPQIIAVMERAAIKLACVQEFFIAGLSWDSHLIERIPPLGKIIGPYAGRQFTPADPLLAAEMGYGGVVAQTQPVSISLDLNGLDAGKGYPVNVIPNDKSRISLVTAINTRRFAEIATTAYSLLSTVVSGRLLKQLVHIKARREKPITYPERYPVPDEKVEWFVGYPGYNPVYYVAEVVLKNDVSINPIGWAHPEDIKLVSEELISYEGEVRIDDSGKPLNPRGRTGIIGRGLLGKWGANFAADPIVTRNNPETGELEMLAIQRKDTNEWAIPGGMVDAGETISATLAREFREETGVELNMDDAVELYCGYVDDPRNTDNAWMETSVMHKHLSSEQTAQMNPQAGDDAKAVKWLPLTEDNLSKLYASHGQFVKIAIQRIES